MTQFLLEEAAFATLDAEKVLAEEKAIKDMEHQQQVASALERLRGGQV